MKALLLNGSDSKTSPAQGNLLVHNDIITMIRRALFKSGS